MLELVDTVDLELKGREQNHEMEAWAPEALALLREKHGMAADTLQFYGVNLIDLVETYGSPLKLTYLPDIDDKISAMKGYFAKAFADLDYRSAYAYHYCTKSSHFSHITEQVLRNAVGLEMSSAFDIPIVWNLYEKGFIRKDTSILCNGFKPDSYLDGIMGLIHAGFTQVVPILDSKDELEAYAAYAGDATLSIGLRIRLENFQQGPKVNSRFGIPAVDVLQFYAEKIKPIAHIQLTTLHFFVESGIGNNEHYWQQLHANMLLYCALKKVNPDLQEIDIGGGMPFQDDFTHSFDFAGCVRRIVATIKEVCDQEAVPEPDIISEFGKYTVAEASAVVFKSLYKKKQEKGKHWLFINGSFITHLPDTWAIKQYYPVFPVNNLDEDLEKVWLCGITTDKRDYYLSEASDGAVLMPKTRRRNTYASSIRGLIKRC